MLHRAVRPARFDDRLGGKARSAAYRLRCAADLALHGRTAKPHRHAAAGGRARYYCIRGGPVVRAAPTGPTRAALPSNKLRRFSNARASVGSRLASPTHRHRGKLRFATARARSTDLVPAVGPAARGRAVYGPHRRSGLDGPYHGLAQVAARDGDPIASAAADIVGCVVRRTGQLAIATRLHPRGGRMRRDRAGEILADRDQPNGLARVLVLTACLGSASHRLSVTAQRQLAGERHSAPASV